MFRSKARSSMVAVAAMLFFVGALYAQEDYSTWAQSGNIAFNTSSSGATVNTNQVNFPVLVRLTSSNAAGIFAAALSDGADIRFSKADGTHLPFELNKWDPVNQKALFWVLADTVLGNSTAQTVKIYWGKSGVTTTSSPSAVFLPSNGFASVLHLNNRTGAGPYTFSDATGQGNNGTAGATVTDTDGVFDRAAYLHCSGVSSSLLAGDSIIIGNLLGSPAQVTLSAWVRVDSVDQANTSGNGHRANIISMGNCVSMSDGGLFGSVTDSFYGAWKAGNTWSNYGYPPTGTTGHVFQDSGLKKWKHAAMVLAPNSATGYMKLYINGDSVRNVDVNNLAITYNLSGYKRTTIGKPGSGDNGQKFGGSIMEVRIDGTPRSSDWIKLCYKNQGLTDNLLSFNFPAVFPPALTSPTNGATNQPASLNLTWSASAGATSYGVQVSTAADFSTMAINQIGVTGTTTSVGLANSKTYYWRVNAASGAAVSAWIQAWSFSTEPPTTVPSLVSPLNGAINQTLPVTFAWNAALGAVSYTLQVSTVSTFATNVVNQGGITATSQVGSGLANGITYYWRLNSYNGASTSQWSTMWSFATIPPAPAAPALSSPANNAQNQALSLAVTWGAVSGAATYGIQVSTAADFSTQLVNSQGLTATTNALSGLLNNTTYFWRANAVNVGGTSAWSTAWSFKTTVGTPALTSPANGSTSQPLTVSLNWGTVAGATAYGVQVSTTSAFTSTVMNQTSLSTAAATVAGLASNMTYYWHVSGSNAGGAGSWSTVWSFSTVATGVLSNRMEMRVTDFVVKNGALSYTLAVGGPVEITFNDMLGRTALSINRTNSAGHYAIALKDCRLAAGKYIVRFKAAGIEKKMMVLFTR